MWATRQPIELVRTPRWARSWSPGRPSSSPLSIAGRTGRTCAELASALYAHHGGATGRADRPADASQSRCARGDPARSSPTTRRSCSWTPWATSSSPTCFRRPRSRSATRAASRRRRRVSGRPCWSRGGDRARGGRGGGDARPGRSRSRRHRGNGAQHSSGIRSVLAGDEGGAQPVRRRACRRADPRPHGLPRRRRPRHRQSFGSGISRRGGPHGGGLLATAPADPGAHRGGVGSTRWPSTWPERRSPDLRGIPRSDSSSSGSTPSGACPSRCRSCSSLALLLSLIQLAPRPRPLDSGRPRAAPPAPGLLQTSRSSSGCSWCPALDEEVTIADTIARLEQVRVTHQAHRRHQRRVLGRDRREILAAHPSADLQVLTRVPPEARKGKAAALNQAWRYVRTEVARSQLRDRFGEERTLVVIVDADGRLDPGPGRRRGESIPGRASRRRRADWPVRIYNRAKALATYMQDVEFRVFGARVPDRSVRVGHRRDGRERPDQPALRAHRDSRAATSPRADADGPWRHRLTEDQDLGLSLFQTGWLCKQEMRHAVNQQGLSSYPPALPSAGSLVPGQHAGDRARRTSSRSRPAARRSQASTAPTGFSSRSSSRSSASRTITAVCPPRPLPAARSSPSSGRDHLPRDCWS